MLQPMGSQRVGHDSAMEQQQGSGSQYPLNNSLKNLKIFMCSRIYLLPENHIQEVHCEVQASVFLKPSTVILMQSQP